MPTDEHLPRQRSALIAYDVCRRALTPERADRRQAMRPVLDAWIRLIGACRAASIPIIYTAPVSRADGADVVLLPTDLSVGRAFSDQRQRRHARRCFPHEIAPRPEDYVFLKQRPSAFYGTGVAELLRMLRRAR